MPEHKKKSGTRKYGRNKEKCEKYKILRKREKSHVKRIKKHLKKYDFRKKDVQARRALDRWKDKLKQGV